jgi:hypothetical protein
MDPTIIVDKVIPYLDYLSAPIFIFAVLGLADLVVSVAVDLMRKAKASYRA